MAKQLFGTDGIRGVAGEPPLDRRTVFAFGRALGKDLKHGEVLIGMDTRESGPWIAAQVAAGLASEGVRTRFAGIVTTPGVAYLTRSQGFAAGVMISASHNPYRDNGLKVFAASGFKLPDREEHLIEQEIFRLLSPPEAPEAAPEAPAQTVDPGLDRQYCDFLLSTLSVPLTGMRLALDCGNGAASHLAPELFRNAGATVVAINALPDGRNINLDCGALYVEGLQDAVLRHHADAGAAFDGDADRAMLVSGSGKIVDGDGMLLIAARSLKAAGHLKGDTVVSTVMANLGLEKALEREGIRMTRTPVGDKYVLEEMERSGAVLGGEQSGHVIFRESATTGDGMLTALRIFEIARRADSDLDRLTQDLEIYPQKLVNVRVRRRETLENLPAVAKEIAGATERLNGTGRVLVRFSGTEPLARVMVEARDARQVDEFTGRIAAAIFAELG
ncbi:MAG: phosphoglucosamine mutase [Acidobacteriota bacterium]|nr:phosphoglucosamine mutase [Acidobacteriota bacterium]